MPARKTTTSTRKTTTPRKTATKKASATSTSTRKTSTPKNTAKTPEIDIEALKTQFQEMGGLIKEDGDRLTISLEDRYTVIQSIDLEQWIQNSLTDIEGIYERGEQEQWINTTFPQSIIKNVQPTETESALSNTTTQEAEEVEQIQETQDNQQNTQLTEGTVETNGTNNTAEVQALKETAQQDAAEIVALRNTLEKNFSSEEIRNKVQDVKGLALDRANLVKLFDIQPDTEDDMELCNQLSSLGVSVQIINTGGDKHYTIT